MISLQGAVTTNNTGATQVTTLNTSVTVNSGVGTVMVVTIGNECSAGAGAENATSVTFNSVNLARIARVTSGTFSAAEVWYLVNPSVTTANVTVNMSALDRFIVGVYVLDWVDTQNPIRGFKTTAGSSATASSVVLIGETGDLVIDSLDIDSTGHSGGPTADQTEQYDLETTAGSTTNLSSTQLGGIDNGAEGFNMIMGWTWTTAAPWSHVAASFRAMNIVKRHRRVQELGHIAPAFIKYRQTGSFA